MKRFFFLFLLCGLTLRADAQIYADVSVSQGGSDLGAFRILLHHNKVPRTVANFIGLATGERNWIDPETGQVQSDKPYYDGLIFHRLDHEFVIQGGDPLGTGQGGPGYLFQDEFDDSLSHSGSYIVSMANSGRNTNGSQFFITLKATPWLDKKHSIFGEVIDDASYPNSRSLIDAFKSSADFPTDSNERPTTPIQIDSVAISGPDLAGFDLDAPAWRLPTVSRQPIEILYDSDADSFSLGWNAERKCDYPVYFSRDLENWFLGGYLLQMDNAPGFIVGIDPIATTAKTFYINSKVDYTLAVDAPQNMLANGTILELILTRGSLLLTFDGAGGGTWEFIYDNPEIANESGNIENAFQNNRDYPVPTSGYSITGSSSARFLSLRQITVFLDGPAGPDALEAVQPNLSFHAETSGWFDGVVNTSTEADQPFDGSFSYTAP
jgi:peptidyl-prolyl cis-trans isomerase A (cyclophilin A)